MTAAPPAEWLTIAQVCAELQVSEADWHAWRAAGDTPLHVVMPDGQLRVRAADVDRWLDSLADDAPAWQAPEARTAPRTRTEPDPYGDPYAYGNPAALAPFRPLSAYWRQRIRDAIDATGDRGLGRAEIWALTSRRYSLRQINGALTELLASEAYEQITVRTGAQGRPPVRYRRTRRVRPHASNAAGNDAGRVASVADERDTSRSATAEWDGER